MAARVRGGRVKQVLQDVRSGEIAVHELPEPGPAPRYALVAVRHSLVSAGTERAMAGLGSKSLVQKARARPDLVRKTIDNARSEGVAATLAKVRGRLDQYTAFGYSCAGEVLDTGGDPRLAVGGLVACVGQRYASHAEVVSVPTSLVVPLPDEVSTADASLLGMLHFANGAAASIAYGVGESGKLPKERIEALGTSAAGVIEDFERLEIFGSGAMSAKQKRDKGHRDVLRAFVDSALGRAELPVPVDEQLAVAAISLNLVGR
jgi:hypothetical protein